MAFNNNVRPGQPPQPPPMFEQETALATQFVNQYYSVFDTNRAQLVAMFRDQSQISFEGGTVQGGSVFINKLDQFGLPPKAAHRVVTVDAQPSAAGSGAILVFVTGEYVGQQFSEVFQLVNQGSYYVHNAMFRVGNTNAFNVPEPSKTVAKQFIEFYYTTFDTNRQALAQMYRPQSNFTLEDTKVQGPQAIMERLAEMPEVQHDPASLTADVQQVNGNALLLIFVTGRLVLKDETNPLNFTETFQIVQDGGSYFIGNHMFKFKYG